MSSGSRAEGGGRPAADADGATTAERTGPSVAERPRTPADDGDAVGVGRADESDGRMQWHRGAAGDQVVLAVEADGVRVAVAFPADAAHEDVRTVLDERDRELRHFFRVDRGDR